MLEILVALETYLEEQKTYLKHQLYGVFISWQLGRVFLSPSSRCHLIATSVMSQLLAVAPTRGLCADVGTALHRPHLLRIWVVSQSPQAALTNGIEAESLNNRHFSLIVLGAGRSG